MSREIELLTEIRDLLEVIAEPQLAKRDKARRAALRGAVGSSPKKAKAALLMDGSRAQIAIAREAGLDKSDLSKFVKALVAAGVMAASERNPKLNVKVPPNFFEAKDGADE
jgi:hypothetical protein